MKTGQGLSKMSKPTALNTEGTAQVSEWLNISDTAKKLYDDDCFYYHSWRNNVVIAFGTLSSFLT